MDRGRGGGERRDGGGKFTFGLEGRVQFVITLKKAVFVVGAQRIMQV